MKYLCTCILLFCSLSAVAQSGKAKIAEGNKAYDKKAYAAAEDHYRQAANELKDNYEANFNLGDALYQQKKYQEAAQQFQKTQTMSQNKKQQEQNAFNTGNALLKENKVDESIEAYKKALKANPDDLNAKYNLSYALAKKKKQEQEKQEQKPDKKDKKDQQAQKNKGGQAPQPTQGGTQNENVQPDMPGQISKAEAERILNALKNDEQKTRQRMYKNGPEDKDRNTNEKPW